MKDKKYVVTCAQYNARANSKFLDSLKHYCDQHQAELVVMGTYGKHNSERTFRPSLTNKLAEFENARVLDGTEEFKFNSNIRAQRRMGYPQNARPLTGLRRRAAKTGSLIIENPKQYLEVAPTSVDDLPRLLMSTGACTRPNYNDSDDKTTSFMRLRKGLNARDDHTYGAVILEIENDKMFHARHIKSSKKSGRFVDLGIEYHPDGSQHQAKLTQMILGDWHVGDTDPQVRDATFRMFEEFSPKEVYLHDFFNGHSISHHLSKQVVNKAKMLHTRTHDMTLEGELEQAARELEHIYNINGKRDLYLVASNHNEWIDRYIQDRRFVDDDLNFRMAVKIADAMNDGKDALEFGLRYHWNDMPDNINFLGRRNDHKRWGYLLGAHGDRGKSGARGSICSIEESYGKAIVGHSHTPANWNNDTLVVGTSTRLDLPYTDGYASSWMNTHALIWEHGRPQLINIIDGKYRNEK